MAMVVSMGGFRLGAADPRAGSAGGVLDVVPDFSDVFADSPDGAATGPDDQCGEGCEEDDGWASDWIFHGWVPCGPHGIHHGRDVDLVPWGETLPRSGGRLEIRSRIRAWLV